MGGGLPTDPFMLFSVVNTKLRDQYASLEALCEDMDVDQKLLEEKLAKSDFFYNKDLNKFV